LRGTIPEPFDVLMVFGGPHGGSGQTSGNGYNRQFQRSALNPHEDPQIPLAHQRALV